MMLLLWPLLCCGNGRMTFYVQLAPFSLNKRWRREQQRSHGKIEIASASNRQRKKKREKGRKKEKVRKDDVDEEEEEDDDDAVVVVAWPFLTLPGHHHHLLLLHRRSIQHKSDALRKGSSRPPSQPISIDLLAHVAKKIVDLMSCGPSLTKTSKLLVRDNDGRCR